MAKTLHPKIQALKDRTAGEYLSSRYAMEVQPDMKVAVEDEGDDWIIKGYLAVFGVKDAYGTRAIKGCFAKSLKERGPTSSAKNKIIHLYFHKIEEPVGQYRVLKEDDYGLYFECVVDKVPGRPEQTYLQTRSGTLNQFSFGFNYIWDKMEYNAKLDCVDMYECDLYEGSSVAVKAANPETYAIRSKEDLQARLIELGAEAEAIIVNLPRKNQLEIRQLITSYKSLAEFKPIESVRTLDLSVEPTKDVMVVGGYKLDVKQFKN